MMTGMLKKWCVCFLLICMIALPASAELPVSASERYAQELSLLNRYLQKSTGEEEGLDINAICETFAQNGNIGKYATAFMLYAEVLSYVENGDYDKALAGVENLQSSASFEEFRGYLQDGKELQEMELYAIRPLDELEAYVHARESEAQGRYADAAQLYDQCQMFFDSYARMSYAMNVTPSLTRESTSASSNILASYFVELFSNPDSVGKNTREIRFQSTMDGAPEDAVDVSQEMDGSVCAWIDEAVLHIAANGLIFAPGDSSWLFSRFSYFDDSAGLVSPLEKIDFGECFDTSNVTDMSFMFSECSSLTELDVSGFDTSNVKYMLHMFSGCQNLNELDVSGFDTSNVTDMGGMFSSCQNLNELDVSGFDTSNVTDMGGMFSSCQNLNELDVSGFDTSNVTDMAWMFAFCYNLTELDVSGFDTSNVTDMSAMFYNCKSLLFLDTSGFDMSNVSNNDEMFTNCPAK